LSVVIAAKASFLARIGSSSHRYGWVEDRSSIVGELPKSESRFERIESTTSGSDANSELLLQATNTSTEQLPVPGHLEELVAELFLMANEGLYEDDQIRKFSDKLSLLVQTYGDATITSLAPYVIGERASTEPAAVTLRCLSHLENRVSYNFRLWLMERALQSSSSWIRDAAALALESMDDPTAIPYLREAFDKESNPELRQYLHSVLEFLGRKR